MTYPLSFKRYWDDPIPGFRNGSKSWAQNYTCLCRWKEWEEACNCHKLGKCVHLILTRTLFPWMVCRAYTKKKLPINNPMQQYLLASYIFPVQYSNFLYIYTNRAIQVTMRIRLVLISHQKKNEKSSISKLWVVCNGLDCTLTKWHIDVYHGCCGWWPHFSPSEFSPILSSSIFFVPFIFPHVIAL